MFYEVYELYFGIVCQVDNYLRPAFSKYDCKKSSTSKNIDLLNFENICRGNSTELKHTVDLMQNLYSYVQQLSAENPCLL